MRFSILSRSAIGYVVVFCLLAGLNVYAILKLDTFNAVVSRLVEVDVSILGYKKKLVDSILSELRYEQKYVLTKDPQLHKEFVAANQDFEKYLAEAHSIADSAQMDESFRRIRAYHQRYAWLVNTEASRLKGNVAYSRAWYRTEKEKSSDTILKELENLETQCNDDVYKSMRMVSEAGASTRKVALTLSLTTLFFTILASLVVTRSITSPLSKLVKKTREISSGNFQSDLDIQSPPEISELARAFNSMCERLKAVDKMKAEFLSMISHELRTPLTTIKEGNSLLLERVAGPVTEKQERLLGILAAETRRLIELVNSILDLSKMEAGMMSYTLEEGSVGPLIEKVVTEMAPLMETRRIGVETLISDELPVSRIDPERILQVLRNLIGNAIKFAPQEGRIRVCARRSDTGVEITVEDTGAGIPKEHLATIFERFQTADRKKGTGLGLAIVKHIITAHGGKVWAENRPGGGALFAFVLPF